VRSDNYIHDTPTTRIPQNPLCSHSPVPFVDMNIQGESREPDKFYKVQ